MKNCNEKALAAHLDDYEWYTKRHSPYVEVYVADHDDNRDHNEAEEEIPVEIVKLLQKCQPSGT